MFFFCYKSVEINLQRIRRGFAMLCNSTETIRRLFGNCNQTALQIDSQWSRSQRGQSVKAALIGHTENTP